MNNALQAIFENGQSLVSLVTVHYTEVEYQEHLTLTNALIDEVGENEQHSSDRPTNVVGLRKACNPPYKR